MGTNKLGYMSSAIIFGIKMLYKIVSNNCLHCLNYCLVFLDYFYLCNLCNKIDELLKTPEVVVRRCSIKKVFLKISLRLGPATLLKKRLWHRCFPVNVAKFLITSSFIKHLRWLLLQYCSHKNISAGKFRFTFQEKLFADILLQACIFIKKRLEHWCFTVKFTKS